MIEKKAEEADMLVFWVLPTFFTPQGVVGLVGLGAWTGRGIVLCRGPVAALTDAP